MSFNRVDSEDKFLEEAKENCYVEYALDGDDAVLIHDTDDKDPSVVTSAKYSGEEDEEEIEELLDDSGFPLSSSVTYSEHNSETYEEGSCYHFEFKNGWKD